MSTIWRDLMLGIRTAWRTPAYSAITIATLALAIGANTLLFSIANPITVRALPIDHPEGIAWIQSFNTPVSVRAGQVSAPDLVEFRERARSFASLAGYRVEPATLSGHQQDPERISAMRATANLTEVWGMKPAIGRLFQESDGKPGQTIAAVLSMRYWRERFQQDPNVIGRQLLLNNQPLVIVGVMPAELELGNLALIDMWTPTTLDPNASREARTFRVLGRLAPGASVESANAEIAGIARQQAEAHPDTNKDWQARAVSTRVAVAGNDVLLILTLLTIVVAFVLLIACANLANLVMARLNARRIDLAVRQALGASRWQLVRPLMIESTLLSAAGGLFGVGIAYGGLRIINAVAYEAYFKTIGIDANVLWFAALISIATPLLFCLWPAVSAGRSAAGALRDSRSNASRAVTMKRNVLVAGQVALALSLLVMSTLAVRSMLYLHAIDTGLDVAKMAMFRYALPEDRYADDGARARFAEALSSSLSRVGGVGSAAIVSRLPVFENTAGRQVEGAPQATPNDPHPRAAWYAVTPEFFQTAGVAMLGGRSFAASDRAGAERVAIVNALAAGRFFGSASEALGRQIVLAAPNEPKRAVTIVGVTEGTRSPDITQDGPQVYVPFAQSPTSDVVALVRSDAPASHLNDMRAAMRALDPAIPITDLRTVQDKSDDEASSDTIINGLFVSFAALALVLAACGLYGVISYSVAQRAREIGVRMALGANPSGVSRMVLGEGLKVTGAGVLAGIVLGAGIAKLAAPVLQGVSPTDPSTFIFVTAVVLVVAVAAILAPALRAMRTDPAITLRS